MKTKKLLSLLLALMMMLSVVPMYASAAQIALKATHVTEWPTASGEMYYGQKIGDYITLTGGKVVYEGVDVSGHFEHIDPDITAEMAMDAYEADIKFVPDDSTAYKGFNKYYSKTTFVVHKTTPVLVDENNPPVAVGEYEQGTALSSVRITGGDMVNPYDADESKIKKAKWEWVSADTVINESGYYEAQFKATASCYVTVKENIYVKIAGEAVATTITEAPTVADMTYGVTRNDIVLVGGKAMAGDTEVAGTFTLNYTDDTVINVGTYNLPITFTPDDTEAYLPSTGTAVVTVNPAPIKFVDENGAECVPEITVPYGTKLGDRTSGAGILLAPYLKLNDILYYVTFVDSEGNTINKETLVPVGTNEYKVKVSTDNKNYEDAELTFKLTVEATDVKVNIFALTDTIQVRKANSNNPTPTGTFAIYVDGQLLKDGVKHNHPVEWNPTASKIYTIKAVYTPVENDPINVEDVTITLPVALERKITYSGNINGGNPSYLCGATVAIRATAESFEGWVITDANGNAVDLGIADLTATSISFTMPDYDLNIEAKAKKTSSGGLDIDGIFGGLDMDELTQGDSDCALINIIRNIIAKFKTFLQELIETFRSIGD